MNERNLSDLVGAWLCREAELRLLASGQVAAQAAIGRAAAPAGGGRVAVVPIVGVLSKSPAWFSGGLSYGEIRQRVNQAAAAPEVSSILLWIDSPGGNSAGCDEAATDIAAAARQKPVYAFCDDLCASGAYYLGSQANKIYANRSALVGSIGVYSVLIDSSKLHERVGLTVHCIKAGEFKAAGGIPGLAIGSEAIKERQRIVDSIYERFINVVSTGRKISRKKAAELADGRVHPAAEAVKLGLIDGVSSFEAIYSQLQSGQAGALPAAVNKPKGPKMEAIDQWNEAVQVKIDRGLSKSAAIREVVREQPELHAAYLAAYNEKHGEAVQGRRR
jgi:signal peptide peptidase SppA